MRKRQREWDPGKLTSGLQGSKACCCWATLQGEKSKTLSGLFPFLLWGSYKLSAPLGTMEGSARTLNFTALLCLGLCWGPWDQAQAGTLPKPSIWADPGLMATKGSSVTLWCQTSLQADAYYLFKERVSGYFYMEISQDSKTKASYFIESMSTHEAGRYQCAYQSRKSWSQRSDLLTLVVTGVLGAPTLSANPGPVVASGVNMSLSCSSRYPWYSFHLLKEQGADVPQHLDLTILRERYRALFPVGPVNTSHGGTYRCYISQQSYPYSWSHPSDPLHLQVTGAYREPSLSAQPGSLIHSGDNLTLQCRSEAGFDRFALTKDEELRPAQHLDGQPSPDFPLDPLIRTHGGRYRCYSGHNLSSTWSAPSAPLDILITGIYPKPSLSAQPGPSVSWGENVTLRCRSEIWFNTFHLSKEGSLAPPQHLHLQDTAIPYEVNFTLNPVTSDHQGTYRCYSSHNSSPYLLSSPSDSLELLVSASSSSQPFLGDPSKEAAGLDGWQRSHENILSRLHPFLAGEPGAAEPPLGPCQYLQASITRKAAEAWSSLTNHIPGHSPAPCSPSHEG
uniref:Ig-like domain-containing protein n=1 Tax=Canis lupus familiaris TaxID=9615 RepID=A0A8C0M604_CANLF